MTHVNGLESLLLDLLFFMALKVSAQDIFIFYFSTKNGNIFWYMRPSA